MKYADLTDEQKIGLSKVTSFLREDAGMFCRFALRLDKELKNYGTGLITQVVRDMLDPNERIPEESGMPGATSISREQWLLLVDAAIAIVDILTPEVEQACNDAAGPRACVG